MAAIERAGRAGAAAGRGLRSLASPAGLRGCGTELAWIAAHAALYPLGVLAEQTGQDTGAHRLDRLSPLQPRPADRRRRGGRHADPAGARAGRQPVGLHRAAPLAAPPRLRPRAHRQLQPAHARRAGRGPLAGPGGRVAVRADGVRAGARDRALARRGDRPLLRAAARRRRPGAHPGHARRPARGTQTRPAAAGAGCAGSCGRARTCSPSWPARRPAAGPGSSPSGATWTRSSIPSGNARIDHPDLDARNVLLRGVGHTSLPVDGRVAREVSRTLAHLDQDGAAVGAPDPADADVLDTPRTRVEHGRAVGIAPFG